MYSNSSLKLYDIYTEWVIWSNRNTLDVLCIILDCEFVVTEGLPAFCDQPLLDKTTETLTFLMETKPSKLVAIWPWNLSSITYEMLKICY